MKGATALAPIALLLVAAGSAATQELPPIDAPRIAAKLVSALKPTKGERVVMAYDPTYYPELERELRARFQEAGAADITSYRFDDPSIAGIREADVVARLRPAFEQADIFLWLPGRNVGGDRRWERLLAVGRARCIHFHWISTLDGKSAEEIATLSRLYEKVVLATDYVALGRVQERLIGALRGKTLRITAPNGTDLRLTAGPWFHKNDGDISPVGARRGPALRDREMEFPSGALRFIPDWSSVEGRLVVTASGSPVTITFQKGRATGLPAGLAARGGDIDKVGELVIGTNPLLLLPAPLPSGELPYYGYGAGSVRVSLGDNWESGGPLRVPGTINQWLFLAGATVEAGGKVLIRDGRIVP
jgi:hypothetical protein